MGYYLSQILLKNDYKVIGSYSDDHAHIPGVEWDYIDYEDQISIRRFLHVTQPNEIYNLAALSSTDLCKKDPGKAWRMNTLAVIRILEWLAYRPKTKFLQAGSIDQLNFPQSIYAQTKHEAYKHLCFTRQYNKLHLNHVFLSRNESFRRPLHFFTSKICHYLAEVAQGKPSIPLPIGNIDIMKEWGHPDDYARACFIIMQQGAPNDYYLTSGNRRTNRDFILQAMDIFGLAPSDFAHLFHIDTNLQREEYDDIRTDISLIKGLGWTPNYTFSQIVEEMVNYYMGTYVNTTNQTNSKQKTQTTTA